jgi:hypothetical protein
MTTTPSGGAGAAGEADDEGYQRMLAARDEIRRLFFSAESRANEYPADAPEVIGVLGPEVLREARQHRVAR